MNRLGWIQAPEHSLLAWDRLTALAAAARKDGLDRTLVCGMGGSSLAPQVLAAAAAAEQGTDAALRVLDSTDPAAVLAAQRGGDLARTLFLVVSKSGTTIETLAFYHYFAAHARPTQFVAVTDAGTPLETLARARGFREVIAHPGDVGGRYAALAVVGMLPAALLGLDGRALLERTRGVDVGRAKAFGAALADAARAGRDKLVLRPPPRVAALAPWIEQLVAESSGKDGRGVVPVVDEPVGAPLPDAEVVTEFSVDPLDLGAEFLRWEYATWGLCERLGVNAFDQPDVEEAKRLAREELERSGPVGAQHAVPLPTLTPAQLRGSARPGDYLAILAYLPPLPDVAARLQGVRAAWGRALGCATTLGFGPRYLHSTGQLHKGGQNTGLFLVITTDDAEDVAIPDLGGSFGALKRAQARGDIRALLARGRRVAHVHLARPEDMGALAPPSR
jgi:transaldolase/glucose-6-phosphate isomerase